MVGTVASQTTNYARHKLPAGHNWAVMATPWLLSHLRPGSVFVARAKSINTLDVGSTQLQIYLFPSSLLLSNHCSLKQYYSRPTVNQRKDTRNFYDDVTYIMRYVFDRLGHLSINK